MAHTNSRWLRTIVFALALCLTTTPLFAAGPGDVQRPHPSEHTLSEQLRALLNRIGSYLVAGTESEQPDTAPPSDTDSQTSDEQLPNQTPPEITSSIDPDG